VCALAVADGPAIVYEARGTIEGRVNDAPAGAGGFGYDPIFFYPPLGRTLAELNEREKASVSHRGQAFRQLRDHLASRPAWFR
jgi:XTP/dITP diphosphohydrolase